MKTPRETLATVRQPLGALLLLVGGGALLAGLLAVALPILPPSLQQPLVAGIGFLPGVEKGVTVTRDDPAPLGYLRVPGESRKGATFAGEEGGWSERPLELHGLSVALFLAACGAAAGLLLHVLWFVSGSRRVVGLALVFGAVTGLLIAHTVPMAPRYWASFWLSGAAGLPGIEERVGSPVGIENEPSNAYLVSAGGRLADHPAAVPPWEAEAVVEVTNLGRAWAAGYGVLGWLGVLLIAAGVRATRWRQRVPVAALGLGLTCWLVLPFLPRVVGETWQELLAQAAGRVGLAELGAALITPLRLGMGVTVLLLPLLVLAWLALLTPFGLLLGALSGLRARREAKAKAQREKETWEPTPEPLEVTATMEDEPAWLSDYEGKRNGTGAAAEAVEPSPAPPEK